MITNSDLQISNKSYVNKAFPEVYTELLDLCKKLTNNWDPSSSNEADPGVVLLKLAAFVADKNNYNIDKNVLECFMPSATQESSMRNLCEMNGYNVGWYKSATTNISFLYSGSSKDDDGNIKLPFTLPKYETVVTTSDGTIPYTLISDCTISELNTTYSASAIQGTVETLTIGDSTTIQLSNLDDNNRVYFSDLYVAENGIFITDTDGNDPWTRVDNLTIVDLGNRYFKFGYDSSQSLPYVEFPSDVATLMGDGLLIKYIISDGATGNISASSLTTLSSPDSVTNKSGTVEITIDDLQDSLSCTNLSSTNDGSDPETIDEAYNNYKKTIGTFNNLVTCRDYANFIYNIVTTSTSTYNNYLVSNIQVADRRTDLNYANNVVSFNLTKGKYLQHQENSTDITPYDLCMYPLAPMSNTFNEDSYVNSFKPYDAEGGKSTLDNDAELDEAKHISQNIKQLSNDDIYCIKNYYTLDVRISTFEKLYESQQQTLINKVKNALYKNFNARQVDFGEEIPQSKIKEVILAADSNIDDIYFSEPIQTTYIMTIDGTETKLADNDKYAKKIVAKNILSGTISLFNFSTDYNVEFGQSRSNEIKITKTTSDGVSSDYKNTTIKGITQAKTNVNVSIDDLKNGYKIRENEVIQFISPNLSAEKSFGAYVNYRYENTESKDAYIPKNTYHQLVDGEVIRINYTDADTEIVHTYVYTSTSATIDGNTTECINIFKSTFDVHQIEQLTNPVTITKDTITYLQVSASDTLDRVTPVTTILNASPLNCYWIMNNSANTLFDGNYLDEETNTITTLLDNGEYFLYSNEQLTELVILGSGTRLTLQNLSNTTKDAITKSWSFTHNIDIESINNDGLSAFSDLDWQVKQLNETNIYVEEMQIKSYVEGDTVKVTPSEKIDDSYKISTLNNSWQELNTNYYTVSGSTTDGTSISITDYSVPSVFWQVRTRLDLNCKNGNAQKILKNQTIYFKDLVGNEYSLYSNTSQGNIDYINFNYITQYTGSDKYFKVNTRTISGLEFTISDGIIATLYKDSGILKSMSKSRDNDGLLKFDVDTDFTSGSLSLDILPLGIREMLVVYYVVGEEEQTLSISATPSNATIKAYNSSESLSKLPDGMHIIDIPSGNVTSLTFKAEGGTVYLGKLKLVDGYNSMIPTNLQDLGDNKTIEDVLTDTSIIPSCTNFYALDNVMSGKEVEANNILSPTAFWDKNNVANKFTIGEIRLDSPSGIDKDEITSITLTKSSTIE